MREDWSNCKLEDIVSKLGDGLHGTPKYSLNGEYSFINGNNLSKGQIIIKENTKKVSKDEFIKYQKALCDRTILVSINGTIGNIAFYNNEKVVLGKSACYFNLYEIADKNYIKYLLTGNGFINYALKSATGSTIKNVPLRAMRNFIIPLAPLPEQRAIVQKIEQLFTNLDKGTENLKTAQEQLKVYRQAVLKKAFEGELTKEWRAKQKNLPTADELLEQIKEEREKHYQKQLSDWNKAVRIWEDGGKVGKKPGKPKIVSVFKLIGDKELASLPNLGRNAVYIRMGNLCDVVRGGSPRPAGDERYYNGNIPFLKVADLTRSKTKYVNTYTYTIKEAGLHKTRLLKTGTLVISNSGATLGVPRILAINATANDGIAAFLGLNSKTIDYLFHYWDSKTTALRSINQGAGQPNLNTELLKNYPIPYFHTQEQHQIVQEIESRLSVTDKMEESIKESLLQAEALRQSILKKAFEGELLTDAELDACRLKDDWESAEELLKRIKDENRNTKKHKK